MGLIAFRWTVVCSMALGVSAPALAQGTAAATSSAPPAKAQVFPLSVPADYTVLAGAYDADATAGHSEQSGPSTRDLQQLRFGTQLILGPAYDNYPSLHLFSLAAYLAICLQGATPTSGGPGKSVSPFVAQTSSGASGAPLFIPSVVGGFELGRGDGSTAIQFFGGARFTDIRNPKLQFYFEVLAGATHLPGETDFTLKPGGGVTIPLPGRKFSVFAGLGVPFIFFSPGHERGVEISGGFSFPIGQ